MFKISIKNGIDSDEFWYVDLKVTTNQTSTKYGEMFVRIVSGNAEIYCMKQRFSEQFRIDVAQPTAFLSLESAILRENPSTCREILYPQALCTFS